MKALHGKVAVITGAASGIGRALAQACAAEGMKLALCDIDSIALDLLADSLRAQAVDVFERQVDVADPVAVETFAYDTAQRFGAVHLVINNAGVSLTDTVQHASLNDMHWLMNINFWGVVHGCRAFLPYLQREPEAALVNISSIYAMLSMPTQSIYNASKAAVRGFSDALRLELRQTGIALTCVHPGGIATDIVRHSRIGDCSMVAHGCHDLEDDFDRIARTRPETAAAAILRAVRRKQRRLLIGADARIADWLYRLFPTRVAALVTRIADLRLRHRKPSAVSETAKGTP